jgi:L-asparaginase type II
VVAVVATGGTIANTAAGRIGIDEVLNDIAQRYPNQDPRAIAEFRVSDVLRAGAETFTPRDWITIGRAVQHAADDSEVSAVLVTHGTFTVEETAYFLHLTVHTPKPIVLVCSQRKHGTIGNDGDKNLLDAVRVATCTDAHRKGALVVLNEEIHSAREVTKTNQRPSGFVSGGVGLLGSVEADRVTFYRSPTRLHTERSEFHIPEQSDLPRVDIVATYAGADEVPIRALVEAGARGIVVSGFSFNGRPHRLQMPALMDAAQSGIPVVLANRGGGGRIPADPSDAFVRADNLHPQKARVLLGIAMQVSTLPSVLQRIFDEY